MSKFMQSSLSASKSSGSSNDPLEAFLRKHLAVSFIFVQWIDLLGQLRNRCLPVAEFKRLYQANDSISVSKGNLGTLQNDGLTPVCDPVGSIYIRPAYDATSLRLMLPMQMKHGSTKSAATIMARYVDENGAGLSLCPKSALYNSISEAKANYGINFLVGFEVEVVFCKPKLRRKRDEDADDDEAEDEFEPLDTVHAWSTFSDEQYTESMPMMLSIATSLHEIGIEIQQVHSESGRGQYEFVLPPQPALHAVDTLMQARQCIRQSAASRKLVATFHPQPFGGIGTAAHAHFSFNSETKSAKELGIFETRFVAGVLEHINSICAITMPQPVSYNRVRDSAWMSGTWIAWGTQNREVPLRKSGHLRWEFRCIDGFANMYLALHAIIAAGLRGVREKFELRIFDCGRDPATLTEQQRAKLGITRKLPATIDQALAYIARDGHLDAAMSPGLLKHYLAMKHSEQAMLKGMESDQRRKWLIQRY